MMVPRLLFVFVLVWLQPTSAWAVDPTRRISQYAHSAWRMQDGAFDSAPRTIVQTPDGYIWIGTSDGVLQFDGVRFVRWTPDKGQQLPNPDVRQLKTTRDGSVWISAYGSVSRWKDRTLTNYASGANTRYLVAEDGEGTVWLGLYFASSVCQVIDTGLRCDDPADGLSSFHLISLLAHRDGTLWVGGDTSLLRRDRGGSIAYSSPALAANTGLAGVGGIRALAATSDGTLWVGIAQAGPGLGLQRVVDGRWLSFDTPAFRGSSLVVTSLYADREGALWVGTDSGLYRIYRDIVDRFDRTSGLSGDYVTDLTEDREGNLWVVTTKGIDRFADRSVVTLSAAEGLCSTEASSVLASRDGSVWTGGKGALTRVHEGRVTCFRNGRELPGSQVTSLFEDHTLRLWIGLDQGLWVYERGRFQEVTRRDGRPIGAVSGIAEDTDQQIWITAAGPPRTLARVEGLRLRDAEVKPPEPRRVAADPTGGLWVGLFNGDFAHVRDGQIQIHAFEHPDNAWLYQFLSDQDGSVIAATTFGLIGWHNGKALYLNQRNGLPCEQVHAIAFDERRDLWLFMNCGLGVLSNADFEAWKKRPDTTVSIQTFDALDGVQPGGTTFVAGARSSDGRVWFANGVSLQVVDPGHLKRNTVLPAVHIERILADAKAYSFGSGLRLPPLTRDLQIDYVGLSFVAPQKVRFRYRLDGRDTSWQEPGDRRQALYTDLRPGSYRFHVIASNNNGVWNEEGASVAIVVEPAWYQTQAALALGVLAFVAVVWAAYRLRVRQLARALNARFDERLVERTRMARDLHDTLLQTLQGTKMVADTALDRPDDAPALVRALKQVSTWIGQASEEGRSAVNALRTSTTEANDLAEAFRRAIDDGRRRSAISASIAVTGNVREMHPVVRDEVYRIGYEAIRNAYTHSRATHLEIALSYGRDLILRVADDGVGMLPPTVERGKEGHFGLPGIRERASRIGASLSVTSTPGAGTAVVVTVPGRAIFRKARTPRAKRLWSKLSGTAETE